MQACIGIFRSLRVALSATSVCGPCRMAWSHDRPSARMSIGSIGLWIVGVGPQILMAITEDPDSDIPGCVVAYESGPFSHLLAVATSRTAPNGCCHQGAANRVV